MWRLLLSLCVLLVAVAAKSTPVENQPSIRRFAFVVGQNDGGRAKPMLRYAASDAETVSKLMGELGGVAQADMVLTLNPSRQQLLQRFEAMKRHVGQTQTPSARTELFFYYSGHSDEDGILLAGEKMSYPDLRGKIRDISSDISIIVLDSCASGNLTRIKGGHKAAPFLTEALSKLKGYVALTSSSSDEVAQESDVIKGSYFTHYLVSGLRGAADMSLDNRVTLNEAYQYAYHQTLSRTEKMAHGAQHPSYSIQLSGSGELVMTDVRRVSAKMVLDKDLIGRVFVRDSKGSIVAEVDKMQNKPLALGLEKGRYSLLLVKDGQFGQSRVLLAENRAAAVKLADFSPTTGESAVTRGINELGEVVDDSDLTTVSVEFGVIPDVSTSQTPSERTKNNFNLNVLYGNPAKVDGMSFSLMGGTIVPRSVNGFQLAPMFNTAERSLTGMQLSGGYNRTGVMDGAQVGGLNWSQSFEGAQIGAVDYAESFHGTQIGGLNYTNEFSGAQIGGANYAQIMDGTHVGGINVASTVAGSQWGGINVVTSGLDGPQIGGINFASDAEGAQIGGINVAANLDGLQLGAINVGADEDAVTVGVINVPRRPTFRAEYSLNDWAMHQLSVKLGSKYAYSFLQLGWRDHDDDGRPWIGKSFGLGGDIRHGRTALNIEALMTRLDRSTWVDDGGIWLSQIRLAPKYFPMDYLSGFIGVTLNQLLPQQADKDFLPGGSHPRLWVGYYAGIELLI